MTDGAFKKAVMNRGGVVEPCTTDARRHMSGVWHGFNEVSPPMVLADTRTATNPFYQDIAPIDRENV
jgi:hypothetical protein